MTNTPEWAKIPRDEWDAMTAEQQEAHKQRVYEWRCSRRSDGLSADGVPLAEKHATTAMSNRVARRHQQMTGDVAW